MARSKFGKGEDFVINSFLTEDEMKATNFSVKIEAPTINTSIRDRSCIVQFSKGTSDSRLNRGIVENIMRHGCFGNWIFPNDGFFLSITWKIMI